MTSQYYSYMNFFVFFCTCMWSHPCKNTIIIVILVFDERLSGNLSDMFYHCKMVNIEIPFLLKNALRNPEHY